MDRKTKDLGEASSVPLFARDQALADVRGRIADRIVAVLESGRYILGEEVEGFEAEFASYLGREYCVGVGNGTDALMIGLLALGVRPGDQVVVPAVSFFATAEAVAAIGAQPVFADVEPGTWTISARTVEPVLSEKTVAIIPVHLFGNPAPMLELLELAAANGIPVLEDAAQAAGGRLDGQMAGALGHAAAFSFYPGKNLGAIGDAGAIVTDDPEVAALARRLRDHGSADRRIHTEVGFNSRLDAIQAAALRVSLPHLEDWTAARRSVATTYREAGLGDLVQLPVETPGALACFHLFVVASPHRDRLHEALKTLGIETRIYYTPVLPEQPALRDFRPPASLPGAQSYGASSLALPMGESLGADAVERVVEAISETLSSFHKLDR